jgi:predicted CoA-binding protein
MSDPNEILRSAQLILLVDWPNRGVPRTLVESGFTVFCASPSRYSVVEVVPEPPQGVDSSDLFPPQEGENGYVVCRRLNDRPSSVDIVNVYRPGEGACGNSRESGCAARCEDAMAPAIGWVWCSSVARSRSRPRPC